MSGLGEGVKGEKNRGSPRVVRGVQKTRGIRGRTWH